MSNTDHGDPGWRTRVLGGGEEPDPRFTLANERTFLAWIRTALALLAGGVAVEALTQDLFEPALRQMLSAVLLVLGVALSGGAFWRWLKVERSMRQKRALPLPLIGPLLGIGIAAIFGMLIWAMVTQ